MKLVRKSLTALLGCIIVSSFILAGCASQSGSVYSSGQARTAHRVSYGTIIAMSPAQLQNDPSGLGALGGAVVGGVVGSTMGGGKGRILTTLGGAILGAIAGTGVESAVRNEDGVEIVVKMESGETISIVQGYGEAERDMVVGDKVRVIQASDGSARVRR